MKNNKILITGGHFTTAFSVYSELKRRGYNNFYWIGHKYSMLKDKEPSAEYHEVTKQNIPFYDVNAGKIYRYFSLLAIMSLIKIPIGFIKAFFILLKLKPEIVISFGGYISVPTSICAWLLNIPVITHEQTASVGLSNKIISKFSRVIMVSWKTSLINFPENRTVLTGNPVRKEIFTNDKNFIEFNNNLKTIFILGGNQGSHKINILIEEILPQIADEFNIIHLCGSNTIYNDLNNLLLFEKKYSNYRVFKSIWGDDFGRALNQADLIISRSGANTVYEIAILNKKAIFIPISYSVNNEQFLNAQILEKAGKAIILEEKNLNQNNLISQIHELNNLNINSDIISDILDNADISIANIAENILNKKSAGRSLVG